MELLETQDPNKKKLIETSDRHKRELEKEVKSMKDRTERMLTNALIIGGSLALTYFVISQVRGSKAKKKKAKGKINEDSETKQEEEVVSTEPSLISKVGTRILSQATMILLDMAKEKLLEYLEARKQRNENS